MKIVSILLWGMVISIEKVCFPYLNGIMCWSMLSEFETLFQSFLMDDFFTLGGFYVF